MALEKITAALVAKFNKEKASMEYYLIPTDHKWWVGETDVIVNESQTFVVDIPTLSQEEFTLKAINTLREKQREAYAEATRTAARLEEKIKELQLLTWQTDPSVIDLKEIVLHDEKSLAPEDSLAETGWEDVEVILPEAATQSDVVAAILDTIDVVLGEDNDAESTADFEDYYTDLQESAYNDHKNANGEDYLL